MNPKKVWRKKCFRKIKNISENSFSDTFRPEGIPSCDGENSFLPCLALSFVWLIFLLPSLPLFPTFFCVGKCCFRFIVFEVSVTRAFDVPLKLGKCLENNWKRHISTFKKKWKYLNCHLTLSSPLMSRRWTGSSQFIFLKVFCVALWLELKSGNSRAWPASPSRALPNLINKGVLRLHNYTVYTHLEIL